MAHHRLGMLWWGGVVGSMRCLDERVLEELPAWTSITRARDVDEFRSAAQESIDTIESGCGRRCRCWVGLLLRHYAIWRTLRAAHPGKKYEWLVANGRVVHAELVPAMERARISNAPAVVRRVTYAAARWARGTARMEVQSTAA